MVSDSARGSAERPFYALHADAYDLLIADPVAPWADAVHDTIMRLTGATGSILDAGCGTGRHAAALIDHGHHVDLVDASAGLLSQAAARCPSARTRLADLCALDVPSSYDAVTCRGVLNDMITDEERAAAIRSLAGCLVRGGVLFLDVRERAGSRRRADGLLRSRRADLGDGRRLTVHSRKTWSDDLLHVEESYELVQSAVPAQRSEYRFTMRPWTEPELRSVLRASGLTQVEIHPGAGRRSPDRLFVVARSPLGGSTADSQAVTAVCDPHTRHEDVRRTLRPERVPHRGVLPGPADTTGSGSRSCPTFAWSTSH